jgi:4-hydroxybenzoate polyprenyltransferase
LETKDWGLRRAFANCACVRPARSLVLAAALLIAGSIYQRTKQFTIWLGVFLIIAAVFNPFAPLHLTRNVWSVLNVVAAALFIGHYFIYRSQTEQQ